MKFYLAVLTLLFFSLNDVLAMAPPLATVQLDLVGDMQGSAMIFQEWAQLLGKAGIRNVRLRAADNVDAGIETQGTIDNPIYVVTGVVRSRDELQLPGRRFRRGEVDQLSAWLDDLVRRGPNPHAEKKAPCGLTTAQFDQARKDLAPPVGFTTQGLACRQLIERITDRQKLHLQLDAVAAQALAEEKINEDLSDVSCGTALAYVLRSAGCGLLPNVADGRIDYTAVKLRAGAETWPVGWSASDSPQQTLPALFEFLNVNIQNVPAATALEAIAKRVKTPVLFDYAALAKHSITPAKKTVTLPKNRTTYGLALRKLLFQAGMKFEVRRDDAGMPFLWITSVKPS